MVFRIGTRPILWHLMKYYSHFGHKEFVNRLHYLGYKGNAIKDYFLHYDESASNDFVWSQAGKKVHGFLNRDIDDWTGITFVETGSNNATIGERLKAVEPHLEGEEMFLANYGIGVFSNANPSPFLSLSSPGGVFFFFFFFFLFF